MTRYALYAAIERDAVENFPVPVAVPVPGSPESVVVVIVAAAFFEGTPPRLAAFGRVSGTSMMVDRPYTLPARAVALAGRRKDPGPFPIPVPTDDG